MCSVKQMLTINTNKKDIRETENINDYTCWLFWLDVTLNMMSHKYIACLLSSFPYDLDSAPTPGIFHKVTAYRHSCSVVARCSPIY